MKGESKTTDVIDSDQGDGRRRRGLGTGSVPDWDALGTLTEACS